MKIIQQLHSALAGGTASFDGITLDKISPAERKFDDEVDKILTKNKLPIDNINEITSMLTEYAANSEYLGFKDGFKLGVRLAAEVFGNE